MALTRYEFEILAFLEREKEGVFIWRFIRCCRTGCRLFNHHCRRLYYSGHAISFKLCSRGDDLRRCGGADSGNVGRRTFKYRRGNVCRRIHSYDGS